MTQATSAATEDSGFVNDVIRIQGKPVETRLGLLDQTQLRFFADNPRVYSIVRDEGKHPDQDDIQAKLEVMDHVRALVQDIKKHGGLIDPLVVKDKSWEVVEGNSRLAAYRLLAKQNPLKWARVKCRILPADMDESLIASLLGQWHLKGKKEWPPYEQAGFLYRRRHDQKVSFPNLAGEAGLTASRVEQMVDAYQLMIDQKDTKRERWSYYDEFVKSRKIAKVCEKHAGLKERILDMVKEGGFERAQDLRDKLPVICSGPSKVITKFATGKLDFDEAHEAAVDAGGDNAPYQKLHKFRLWLAEPDVQEGLDAADGPVREKVDFEVRKLHGLLALMLKKQ
ncbi:MAG TPA: ParB N-terminal domain-containing protein [Gemmatimonadaceae bacterium]|nr:ParB N-terminal domain-containing protein [Gemmatimonadaceae bacterium]